MNFVRTFGSCTLAAALGVTGCASLLGDFEPAGVGDVDADTADVGGGGVDASTETGPAKSESGAPDAGNDAFTTTDGGFDACAAEIATEVSGVFVASGGGTVSCGTRASPCGTITSGLDAAAAQSKSRVYVAAGVYVEALTLKQSGVTIVGGWTVSGPAWKRACDPAATVIQAPATSSTTLLVSGGAPTLDTLTLKSKAQADPGESLYGAFINDATTRLALTNVAIDLAAGGVGVPAVAGKGGAGPTTTCATPGTGAPGLGATPGVAAGPGTFTAAGYVPANGTSGGDGNPGQNGTLTAPDSHICINAGKTCTEINTGISICSYISSTSQSGGAGAPGCAGAPGGRGTGGGGGGSSVGVFSAGAAVKLTGGSVRSGSGGTGAGGGAGGPGTPGSAGSTGATYFNCGECGFNAANACVQTTVNLLGGVGGPGGGGTSGGGGGGGSGGSSFALYAQGGATFDVSAGTALTAGMAGAGGTGNGTGAAGQSGVRGP